MKKQPDYSNWTVEELLTEKKKRKKQELFSALLIGFLFGVLIFGIAKKGFGFIHIFIPVVLAYGIYKNSLPNKSELKKIQAKIEALQDEK